MTTANNFPETLASKDNPFEPICSTLALESRAVFDGAAASDVSHAVDRYQGLDVFIKQTSSAPPPATRAMASDAVIGILRDVAPELSKASTQAVAPNRSEVLFIEDNVNNFQLIIDQLGQGKEVHLLDSKQDGLQQITYILQDRSGIDAIHLVTHGEQGNIELGSSHLNNDTLDKNAELLKAIGSSLSKDGDILLYGCEIGKSSAFIERLADITGADIAASDYLTGSSRLGGDWNLEVKQGKIDVPINISPALAQTYNDVLSIASTTVTFETAGNNLDTGGHKYATQDVTYQVNSDSNYKLVINGTKTGIEYARNNVYKNSYLQFDPYNAYKSETAITLSFTKGQIFTPTGLDIDNSGSKAQSLVFTGLAADGTTTIKSQNLSLSAYTKSNAVSLTGFTGVTTLKITATSNGSTLRFFQMDNIAMSDIQTAAVAPTTTVTSSSLSADTGTSNTDFITKTAAQTISGNLSTTLASGEKVEVSYNGGSTWSDATSYTVGQSTWSTTTTLSGSNTFEARVTNSSGSSTAYTHSYQLDQSAPSAPAAPDLMAKSDSGSSSTDNITNVQTGYFSGTAEANSTVYLYDTDGSTELGHAASDGSGNWQIQASTMSEGTHTVTVNAVDSAGNTSSASSSLSVKVDITAPNAPSTPDMTAGTDTGTSSSDNITGNNQATYTGTTEASAVVYLYDIDGVTELNHATADGSGNWSVSPSSTMSNGIHTITAKAVDVAGNVSVASSGLDLTVVTIAPSVTSTAYNERTGVLTVTGSNFVALASGKDLLASHFTFTGEASGTYTLTDSADVELTNSGSYTITLSTTDKAGVEALINQNGSSSQGGTSYKIAATEGWDAGVAGTIASTFSGKSLSATGLSTISSAAYAASSGLFSISGTNFNTVLDSIDPTKIKIEIINTGSNTVVDSYKLTSETSTATISSATAVKIQLNATDQLFVDGLLNNNGLTSLDGYNYQISAANGFNTTFKYGSDTWHSTPSVVNPVSVSGVTSPTISSATYNSSSNVLTLTGSHLVAVNGSNNDISVSHLSLLGSGSTKVTMTSTDVDIIDANTFSVHLNATDISKVAAIFDKDGTSAADTTPYNIGASASWDTALTSADATNPVTVTTPSPTVSKVVQTSGNNAYKAGDTVTLAVYFDQAVDVDIGGGIPHILLETGSIDEDASYSSGSGDSILVFSYTVQAGDTSADLQYWDTASFTVAGGAITSVANGISADLTLPGLSSGNSLAELSAIVIDTTVPSAPSTPDLDSASDSGDSNSDDNTSTNQPTFTGTAEANATVKLYDTDGTTVIGTTTADGSGNWSLTPSSKFDDGSHTVTVKAFDAAGNVSTASTALAVTIDTTAPAQTVSTLTFSDDTGVSSTDFITSTAKQDISGTLSANLATGESVQISLDNGSTWIDANSTVGKNTFSLSKQTLSGTDTLKVRVVDLAGNNGSIKSQAYTIDSSAPTTTVSTVAFSNDTGVSSTDFITSAAAQTISGTLSANVASGEIVQVSLNNGTAWFDASTSVGKNTYSLAGQTLTDSGTLQVRVIDTAGNAGSAKSQAYEYDNVAPSQTVSTVVFSKDTGVSSSDYITSVATQDISGTLSANLQSGEKVQISLDGGVSWSDASATVGKNAFSLTGQTLSAADDMLVRVIDTAGTFGTVRTDHYIYDTGAPTVSSVALSKSTVTAGSTANLTITFDEKVGNFDNSDVTVENGILGTLASSDGGQTWTATFTPTDGIEDATNVITVDKSTLTDLAGNAGSGSTSTSNYKIDTKGPTATITLSDTNLKIGETTLVTFTFSEAVSGFTNADLKVANGMLSSVSSKDGGLTWTATLTPTANIEASTNVITLDNTGVTDVAGNSVTGTTNSNNYSIDSLAPTFSKATVNGSELVMTYTESGTLDAVNPPAASTFAVLNGGNAVTVNNVSVNAANHTVTLTLASAVTNGSPVTLAYTDPTVSDDVNAIQDAVGNDAASLVATAVTNNTPAPNTPSEPPATPNPPPAKTEQVDGVTVTTSEKTGTTSFTDPVTGSPQSIATISSIITIPIVDASRQDVDQSRTQAYIPLAQASGGTPIITASVPVGIGLSSEALNSNSTTPLTLRQILIAESQPRAEIPANFQEILDQGIDRFVPKVTDASQVTVRTVTFSSSPNSIAPTQPIVINGATGTGESDPLHPQRQEALIIDVRDLPAGTQLQLNNVEFAIIIGATRVQGGNGQNFVVGDNATQFIVLGADDDILNGGPGNDHRQPRRQRPNLRRRG